MRPNFVFILADDLGYADLGCYGGRPAASGGCAAGCSPTRFALMTGNIAKTKGHLAQLDRLCRAGCAEQATLKKKITTFELQQAKK